MKDILAIAALGIIAAMCIFTAHIGQHPESTAASWVNDTATPAIKNAAKNAIKEIPFSGLLRWN